MAAPEASAAAATSDMAAELERLRQQNAALQAELARVRPAAEPAHQPAEQVSQQAAESRAAKVPNAVHLSVETLQQIQSNPDVEVPSYPRDAAGVKKWIMHIGLGGFSRSHLAMLTDELLTEQQEQLQVQAPEETGEYVRWGICGVGLMPWDVKLRDALQPQGYMYTLLSRDSVAGDSARVIGSIMDYMFLPDDPKASLDRLANPATAIVSLTITEKGYCLDSSGNLDFTNKLVQHDLSPGGLAAPQTALGVIVAALQLRRSNGVEPFTVLSCDNLPMNGSLARKAVVALARKVDTALAEWIASPSVAFPSSMVDRITPVTKQSDKDLLQENFGIIDNWPVVAEPFVQWVVEDFAERPAWERCGGVQFVQDVKPYELMKLRLLNSSHSALAYVGYLAGHRLVHDAMADPLVRSFMARYMASVAPTVPPVPGVCLADYQATLIRRFSNSRVADTLLRLAQDGSAKWGSTLALGGLAHSALGAMQFVGSDLGSDPPLFTKYVRTAEDLRKLQRWRQDHLRWRKHGSHGAKGEFGADVSLLDAPRPAEEVPPDVALALAAWVRFMAGTDEAGKPIPVEDPMAKTLQPLARAAATDSAALREFLVLALGESAAGWPRLIQAVARWHTAIRLRGISCALAEALSESPGLAVPAHAGGADLALGNQCPHSRLAVLKLRQARLEAELKEVAVLLDLTAAEAEEKEEEMAKAIQEGLRQPKPRAVQEPPPSPDVEPKLRSIVGSGTHLATLAY